jgi:hypothetical protein
VPSVDSDPLLLLDRERGSGGASDSGSGSESEGGGAAVRQPCQGRWQHEQKPQQQHKGLAEMVHDSAREAEAAAGRSGRGDSGGGSVNEGPRHTRPRQQAELPLPPLPPDEGGAAGRGAAAGGGRGRGRGKKVPSHLERMAGKRQAKLAEERAEKEQVGLQMRQGRCYHSMSTCSALQRCVLLMCVL